MQDIPTLDYATPPRASGDSRTARKAVRYVVLGPFTGAAVGSVQTCTAVLYWLAAGRPDFYFRGGWNGVEAHLLTMCVGGAIVGLFLGALVGLAEAVFHREVRVRAQLLATLLIAGTVYAARVGIEFRDRHLFDAFGAEGYVLTFSGVSALVLSRRQRPDTGDVGGER